MNSDLVPALGYLRVSGQSQIEGDGFPRQRLAIEKYASANEIEVVGWYEDGGVSGKMELENRAGLAAALERIENNGVKLLIVEGADRLARDAMVSEIIVRQFQKVGGVILTASGVNLTEGDDSNPTAALIRGVLALVAEFDRRITVLKLRAARNRKKAKTGRCEGRVPYGGTEQERRTLQTMITLKGIGYTCSSIANSLNASGIMARYGAPWKAGTVSKILAREKLSKPCTSDSSTTTHDEVSQ